MALTKCRECGGQVSTEAGTCPHCGAPVKAPAPVTASKSQPSAAAGCLVVIVFFGLIAWAVNSCTSSDGPASSSSAATASSDDSPCAKTDLQCLGNRGVVGAGIYCKAPIERLALHDVKWTDGFLDMKFSEFRWASEGDGAITYVGDKAEFQNGFGAYTPVVYECDLASDNKTVLAVRIVRDGRLHDGE